MTDPLAASASVARSRWKERTTSPEKLPSQSVVASDTLYKFDRVIFPDNKWIKLWDLVVLACLFLLTFILPYQIGVSGAYLILVNIPWLVVNVIINAIFFVDTFLYFFRAYRTKDGLLIFSLRKIQRRYLMTYFVPNFLSVLPFTIVFYFVGNAFLKHRDDPNYVLNTELLNFIMFAGLLKLVRLVRVRAILSSSDVVTNIRLRHNSQVIQLWSYVLVMVIVSHWFACIWCFVAYLEARGYTEDALLSTPNWIGNWYLNGGGQEYSQDGGINPLGLTQFLDRYVLSLFWAIQTITSIGYGNIAPVTRAEWWVGCFLQLCAGMMWAYVIGGLVGVAAGMQVGAEEYRNRIDRANELIHEFDDPGHVNERDDAHTQAILESNDVAKRIRLYIHKQYKASSVATCASSFSDIFPAYDTLTPELQRMASILVMKKFLEAVPYLSSRYLNTNDQSQIAMNCFTLEFSNGEVIQLQDCVKGLGRGIFVIRSGCVYAVVNKKKAHFHLLTAGMVFGAGKALIEDSHPSATRGTLQFLTFSKVVFIPRSVALAALERNERAWKDCARWMYLRTLLRDSASLNVEGADGVTP